MDVEEYIETAKRLRLDGICFTEHDTCWDDDEFEKLRELTGGLVIINAQEVRCWDEDRLQGDFLVYGCKKSFDRIDAESLIDFVHRAGGVVVAAHPYRPYLGCGELVFELKLDGLEIHNSNNDGKMDNWTRKAGKKLGLPLIGGSDAHTPDIVGWGLTRFEDNIRNEDEFVSALKAGRFEPLKGVRNTTK